MYVEVYLDEEDVLNDMTVEEIQDHLQRRLSDYQCHDLQGNWPHAGPVSADHCWPGPGLAAATRERISFLVDNPELSRRILETLEGSGQWTEFEIRTLRDKFLSY